MKLNEEPRLPDDSKGLQWQLTKLLRDAFRQINLLTDRSDTPIDAASAITVGASPYTYTPTNSGIVVVTGGTVSQLDYGRQGAFTSLGITAGVIPVKAGDSLRITYTVAPTATFIRQ